MAVTISLDNIDVSPEEKPTATASFTTYKSLKERDEKIKREAKDKKLFKKVTGSFRDAHLAWVEAWEKKLNIK